MKRLVVLLTVFCCGVTLWTGCAAKPDVVRITEQYGTAYAPIALMRERGLLEERLPEGTQVEWSQMSNTAAIRESMLAGKTDLACMAIPPFLIGRDGGMRWRICAGVSQIPMGLVARDPAVKSVGDIAPRMRIALPQPGSIQHILLAMAAGRELGEPGRFDNQLVTMSHPDGASALLLGGEVDLHFTTAPYLGQELEGGMSLVLTGEEAMGGAFTGIVSVAGEEFRRENSEAYQAFLGALEEACAMLQADPAGCAQLLAPVYNMTPEDLEAELTAPGAAYRTQVEGVEAFHDFMLETGYLANSHPMETLFFEEAAR